MGLESPTYVSDLNAAWPLGTDAKSQGDNHFRALKSALQATFPGGSKPFYFPTAVSISNADNPYSPGTTAARNILIRVDASGGAVTINLPAVATVGAGAQMRIIRVAGSNTITLDGNLSEEINGATTRTIGTTVYDGVVLETDGTRWNAIAGETAAAAAQATVAELRAKTGTDSVGVDVFWDAHAEVTLTDAATIAVDMNTFINAVVTVAGNRIMGSPTNEKVGQSGVIRIVESGSGRTITFGSDWEFVNGVAPQLTGTASAQNLLFYHVVATNRIFGQMARGIS